MFHKEGHKIIIIFLSATIIDIILLEYFFDDSLIITTIQLILLILFILLLLLIVFLKIYGRKVFKLENLFVFCLLSRLPTLLNVILYKSKVKLSLFFE